MDWVTALLILSVVIVVCYSFGYVMTDRARLEMLDSRNKQESETERSRIALEMEKLKIYAGGKS